ncbi:hypothetical protein ASG67_14960 [Sphingomonas sp. Leaf339]|uniref:DUF3768 domain-containing protein n=1 Tax=Sphingomonas sp. Leaf339 TaxID=1736343 RepID=UPI0006F61680|nr:DUF3768 domain-containing protein [Sphingomonas sp. Leaf339]KQU46956.1 hypothetical protein ASG67_14960 [Sphingomonas sp. Leaf339]
MTAKPTTHAPATPVINPVAQLNDAFRTNQTDGRMIATAGVIGLGPDALPAILLAVQTFDAFTPDDDPYGEHDFGVLIWANQPLFWKIDYYDRAMQFASPDPADAALTLRVLTIMLASEY